MSRIETHTLTMTVRVYDPAALSEAAIKHAMTVDGMTEDEARETLADGTEDDGIDVGACLQMLFDPGVSPDGCSIEESRAEYLYGEDDDSGVVAFAEVVAESLDLSGGDPGYALVYSQGPVILTLEAADSVTERKAAFRTIADAETYIGISTTIDPVDREAGHYGIDAPHGVGSDSEAIALAVKLRFNVFMSMGGAYFYGGPRQNMNWSKSHDSIAAAALAALATVEPDE